LKVGISVAETHPLKMLEDHIGEHLRDCETRGELREAPSFGRPLQFNDGYDETPVEWRMAMKILHDAGIAPPEVELFHQLAALKREAAQATDPEHARLRAKQASDLGQLIRLRLERFRSG
jgi:hypothetical protein